MKQLIFMESKLIAENQFYIFSSEKISYPCGFLIILSLRNLSAREKEPLSKSDK